MNEVFLIHAVDVELDCVRAGVVERRNALAIVFQIRNNLDVGVLVVFQQHLCFLTDQRIGAALCQVAQHASQSTFGKTVLVDFAQVCTSFFAVCGGQTFVFGFANTQFSGRTVDLASHLIGALAGDGLGAGLFERLSVVLDTLLNGDFVLWRSTAKFDGKVFEFLEHRFFVRVGFFGVDAVFVA